MISVLGRIFISIFSCCSSLIVGFSGKSSFCFLLSKSSIVPGFLKSSEEFDLGFFAILREKLMLSNRNRIKQRPES